MLIKILLKIWPALVPIVLYIVWSLIIKKIIFKLKQKNKIIEGEKIIGEKSSVRDNLQYDFDSKKLFNFRNTNFVITLYFSLIVMILCLIILAF